MEYSVVIPCRSIGRGLILRTVLSGISGSSPWKIEHHGAVKPGRCTPIHYRSMSKLPRQTPQMRWQPIWLFPVQQLIPVLSICALPAWAQSPPQWPITQSQQRSMCSPTLFLWIPSPRRTFSMLRLPRRGQVAIWWRSTTNISTWHIRFYLPIISWFSRPCPIIYWT